MVQTDVFIFYTFRPFTIRPASGVLLCFEILNRLLAKPAHLLSHIIYYYPCVISERKRLPRKVEEFPTETFRENKVDNLKQPIEKLRLKFRQEKKITLQITFLSIFISSRTPNQWAEKHVEGWRIHQPKWDYSRFKMLISVFVL